ncbi:MAG: pyrimidine 5'-nucleotidase [Mariprofundaceae bacterium]|nr:pyrimidine 5'-nucleotidase [Mariprofundaceae bacterium]
MLKSYPFTLAVIDLDNTLYAANNGVFARMDQRMNTYICRELGLQAEQANALRLRYWQQYGSTLKGLMLHHQQAAEPFLDEVHDIQAHELLTADPQLNQMLTALTVTKVIHTNGTQQHAESILTALGIRHHFARIYDIRFNDYTPKPCSDTLLQLFAAEKVAAHQALVIDDMPDNLQAAQHLGAQTAWIHQGEKHGSHTWDMAAKSMLDLDFESQVS